MEVNSFLDLSTNNNSQDSLESLENSVYSIKLGDLNYDDSLKLAEEFKETGNKLLNANKFSDAIDKFTDSINLGIETKKNAIYYSNRAFCNIKLENFGLAIQDANKAIEIDKDYIKAYYRRASANLLLSRFDEAVSDLEFLANKFPTDQALAEKLQRARVEKKRKRFLESLKGDAGEEQSKKFSLAKVLNSTKVETSYSGAVLPDDYNINHEWVVKVMEDMKENKFIHKKYLLQIMVKVKEYYDNEKCLVDIEIPEEEEFNVCGDIHGQYYDLLNIFKINGYPSKSNPYLFNGDFVDRGSFSVECIVTLLCWKLLYPQHFHMTRGNHESRNMNKLYGFEGEVKKKYDESVYEAFCELFCSLPLGHVLNKKVLVVHGGLFSQDGITLDMIKSENRFREPPEKGIMCEILWSDPSKLPGRHPSKRGVGVSFGPDIAKKFLDSNSLDILVRSHEVKTEGYEEEADGRVITIFSAPNYCDQMGNKGALIRFRGDSMKPKYVQYAAVDHPTIPPMRYANPWMFF